MLRKRPALLLLPLNLLVICAILVAFANRSYPRVGHDYSYSVPQVLDSVLWFQQNGLSIQWYTPSFGAGIPAYPDPNNAQFSLPVLFSFFMEPWLAFQVEAVLFVVIGALAAWRLFSRLLGLHWTSSLVGVICFSANGFILERFAVGHVGYLAFPLLALLLVLMIDPALPMGLAGAVFGLVLALLLHQMGFLLFFVFGFSILILLPMVHLLWPSRLPLKRCLAVAALGALFGLLLSASKLAAVFSFMRFFPRQIASSYQVGLGSALLGLGHQLLGTMTLAPFYRLAGMDLAYLNEYMKALTGGVYGYWEFDMSLSPVVFGLLLIGAYLFLKAPRVHAARLFTRLNWPAWIVLAFSLLLAVEFTLGRGVIYPALRQLPILSSLHVNPRFAAAFLLPLVLAAVFVYERGIHREGRRRRSLPVFALVNLLALLPLVSYFLVDVDLQKRTYDVTRSRVISLMARSGWDMTVTSVASGLRNTDALLLHQSNLEPYAPIFGYELQYFRPQVIPGSAWLLEDDYFNFTNPAGYVFPDVNGVRLFERFRVQDAAALQAFLSHQDAGFRLPLLQQVLDWVSGLSFALSLLAIAAFLVWRFLSCVHQRRLHARD